MKFHFSPATGCGPRIVPERNFFSQREPLPYTEVIARSPGLQCEASYPGFGSPVFSTLKFMPYGVSSP